LAYEPKDGSGALFKNERKQEGTMQPDYTGNALVNGETVEIAAWIKTTSGGKKFMSLSFKPPREPAQHSSPKAKVKDDFPDDCPF